MTKISTIIENLQQSREALLKSALASTLGGDNACILANSGYFERNLDGSEQFIFNGRPVFWIGPIKFEQIINGEITTMRVSREYKELLTAQEI